jgi:hypothetical protein
MTFFLYILTRLVHRKLEEYYCKIVIPLFRKLIFCPPVYVLRRIHSRWQMGKGFLFAIKSLMRRMNEGISVAFI